MACEVPHSAMADSEPMLGSAWSVRFEDMDFLLRIRDDDCILWMWMMMMMVMLLMMTGLSRHRAGRQLSCASVLDGDSHYDIPGAGGDCLDCPRVGAAGEHV